MRVLVCGSRDWTDVEHAYAVLESLGPIDEIIEGGAKGADELGRAFAHNFHILCTTYRADWERYGRRAGIVRNLLMLDANPDLVVAFHKGKSRGTAHTIREAQKRGIRVLVCNAE